jgi:tetratricopeptide (TPR) repeat protein
MKFTTDLLLWIAALFIIGFSATDVRSDEIEEAYAINQEAMVDMSMAQFDSAAKKFLMAAAIITDYQIRGQKLRYTPTFMAAWAFEKEGHPAEACRHFRRFLEIAPQEHREKTKVDHAVDYLHRHCQS